MNCLYDKAVIIWVLISMCALLTTSSEKINAGEETTVSVGAVTAIEGNAKSKGTDGDTIKLDIDTPVKMGDTLYTGWRSKLEITFKDGTAITIGAKANLVIDEFTYNPETKKGTCKTSLTRGAFKVLGGQISKSEPDKTMVKTPVAYIGIRGTTCIGTASSRQTTAIFTEGKAISVSNDMGSTILEGQAGMGCETFKGQAPGTARLFSGAEINNISVQVSIAASTGIQGNASQPHHVGASTRRGGGNTPRTPQPSTNVRHPTVSHHHTH